MRKLFITLIPLLLTITFAREVMLVTDLNSPDSFSASVAAKHSGIPVLLTINGLVNDEILSSLNELNATEVIVIGGPVVVKEQAISELENNGFNVTRLWGIERTDTAIEVMKYFWNNSSCVVLAQDTFNKRIDSLIQSEAVNKAIINDCPIIPLMRNTVSDSVIEALNDMGVTNVTYIGSGLNNDSINKLSNFNLILINGSINKIRNEIIRSVKFNGLLIVAAPKWNYTITTSSNFNNHTMIRVISNTSELNPIIDLISNNNLSPIRIVGEPTLANEIFNELNNSGINATLISGRPFEISRRLALINKEKFNKARLKFKLIINKRIITNVINRLRDRINKLKEEGINTTIIEQRLDSINDNNSPKKLIRELSSIRTRIFVKERLNNIKEKIIKRRIKRLRN